ncbi:hypothetical protein CYY_000640 [Polysphondylium violaceum]|uniref:Right handed beta helix domain-containing protein n=1 Tax=Polysphondylium violaceum TaxID=133409 RepID=A0A8J4VBD6_9MYCE|nr:hypothetical protein CYY_000640 [Polysphondylium violaceum]
MIKYIVLLVILAISCTSAQVKKECTWWLSYESQFIDHTGTFQDPFARLSNAINAVFTSTACPVDYDNSVPRYIYMITSETGVYKGVGNREISVSQPESATFQIFVVPVDKGAVEAYPMQQSQYYGVIDGENTNGLLKISELFPTLTFKGIYWKNGSSKQGSTFGASIVVAGQTNSVNFDGCKFENLNGGKTGSIYFNAQSDSVINNCTFINNSATGYGGVFYFPTSFSKISLLASVFSGNKASVGGGSIYSSAYTLLIKNTQFKNGNAAKGGALYIEKSPRIADLVWDQLNFVNNMATDGGALYDHMSSIEYTNAVFTKNNATNGGACYFDTSTSVFSHSLFQENTAINGGAVWTIDKSLKTAQLLIKLSNFNSNRAEIGGAMYCNASTSNLNTQNNYSMNYATPAKDNTTIDFCTSSCLTASAVCGCYSGCGIPPVPPKVITDTKETKIAIGIFLPVTAILLGVVIFLLWKTNEKAKQKKANLNYDEIKLTIPDNSNDPL